MERAFIHDVRGRCCLYCLDKKSMTPGISGACASFPSAEPTPELACSLKWEVDKMVIHISSWRCSESSHDYRPSNLQDLRIPWMLPQTQHWHWSHHRWYKAHCMDDGAGKLLEDMCVIYPGSLPWDLKSICLCWAPYDEEKEQSDNFLHESVHLLIESNGVHRVKSIHFVVWCEVGDVGRWFCN